MDTDYHLHSQTSLEDANRIKKEVNRLIENVLYELDQLQTSTFEYQMEMFHTLDELYRKEQLMCEYETDPELTIQEAAAVASKPKTNKVIAFLRRILQAIGRAISKMVNAITSFFSKKSKWENVNVIASQVIPPQVTAKVTRSQQSRHITTSNGVTTIHIPTSSNSKVSIPELKIHQADIDVIFSGTDEIIFEKSGRDYSEFRKQMSSAEREDLKKENVRHARGSLSALILITDKDKQKKFLNCLEHVVNVLERLDQSSTNSVDAIERETRSIEKMIGSFYDDMSDINRAKTFKTTVDEIKSFQSQFGKLHKRLLQVFDADIDYSRYPNLTARLTSFGNELADIQMSLNYVTSQILQSNHLQQRFWGTVNDAKLLAKFVKACINAGIPYKFMMYNTWLICSNDLRGGDQYAPTWGQSRGVFFPTSKPNIIYKIALSGWGVTSNKTEADITRILKKTGNSDDIKLIPAVLDQFENYAVIEMERLKIDKSKTTNEHELVERFREALKRYNQHNNKNVDIEITDTHSENIGWDTNRNGPVFIDYGWGLRFQ